MWLAVVAVFVAQAVAEENIAKGIIIDNYRRLL